jgi:catechol 2,3-dioxygenase-like lactoylglutathione lyase family enzyme
MAFYRALGFDFQAEQHGSRPEHFACEKEDWVFELYPANEPSDIKSRLGFRVTSLEETIKNLRALGIKAVPQDSDWGIRAIVRDPDGRTVEISELS